MFIRSALSPCFHNYVIDNNYLFFKPQSVIAFSMGVIPLPCLVRLYSTCGGTTGITNYYTKISFLL